MIEIAMKITQGAIFWSAILLAYQTIITAIKHHNGHINITVPILIMGALGAVAGGLLGFWRRFWDTLIIWLQPDQDIGFIPQLTGGLALVFFFMLIWWFHAMLRSLSVDRKVSWKIEHRLMVIVVGVNTAITVMGL